MHTKSVFAYAIFGLTLAGPAAAQHPYGGQGIPPGHLPSAGFTRASVDTVLPTSARTGNTEVAAAFDQRVILGVEIGRDRYRGNQWNARAFDSGYRDGYNEGRREGRGRGRYSPSQSGWYRGGSRGYSRDFGPRDRYRSIYREGFMSGYDAGFRDARGRDNRGWRR